MKTVYFIRPIGRQGPVKVGCSKLPESRIKAIDIWSPFPLEIIAAAPGDHHHERAVHWHLRDSRLHGEWFRWSARLSALVAHVQSNGGLPPLEASPYGKTGMGRGNNPSRNPEWAKAKARVTSRVRRAERHAFGPWALLNRTQRVRQLIGSYQGPFSPPPNDDVLAELELYIAGLLARPKDTRPWSEWFSEENRAERERSWKIPAFEIAA